MGAAGSTRVAAFLRASHMLAGCWTSDDGGRRNGNRDFDAEYDVSRRVQEFLLRTSREGYKPIPTDKVME